MDGNAGRRHVDQVGEHQGAAVGQPHQFLSRGAAERPLADQRRALVARESGRKHLGGAGRAVVRQHRSCHGDGTIAGGSRDGFLLLAAVLAIGEHARLDEQPCRRETAVGLAEGGAAQVHDQARRARLGQCRDFSLQLTRGGLGEFRHPEVADAGRGEARLHRRSRQLFADHLDVVRFGGVAAQYGEAHLGAGFAAQQALTFVDGGVARGLAIDGADVVADHQSGASGGRAIPRRDHAEVILARQLKARLR